MERLRGFNLEGKGSQAEQLSRVLWGFVCFGRYCNLEENLPDYGGGFCKNGGCLRVLCNLEHDALRVTVLTVS